MGLRSAVAAPFRHRGDEQLTETEFVAAVAMELRWFTPDQAKRLVDVAVSEGALERSGGQLTPTFDVHSHTVPEEFEPDEQLLQQRSTFEKLLERIVAAGHDKQEAVAAINQRQQELGVSIEAAAVVYARQHGIAVGTEANEARAEL